MMDQPNKISVGDMQRKLETFTSWKNEMSKEPIQPIEEEVNETTEPTIDILPIPLTEEEKLLVESATEEVKIINVEAVTEPTEKEDEVKIINDNAVTESTEKEDETELMPLTEVDKQIIEEVENIIAPAAKSKRAKQKLVIDDKQPPVIKPTVKVKVPKPKTITLAANQVLQIKLPDGQQTCNIQFI